MKVWTFSPSESEAGGSRVVSLLPAGSEEGKLRTALILQGCVYDKGQGSVPRGGWNLMRNRQIDLGPLHSHAIPDARWERLAQPAFFCET